jgi:hypothetical protein
MKSMKHISIFLLLLFVFAPDMFASGYDGAAHKKVVDTVSDSLGIIFFFMKLIGFLILIFSLVDLISNSNGKSGSDKALSSATRIILSSFFIGVEAIYKALPKTPTS